MYSNAKVKNKLKFKETIREVFCLKRLFIFSIKFNVGMSCARRDNSSISFVLMNTVFKSCVTELVSERERETECVVCACLKKKIRAQPSQGHAANWRLHIHNIHNTIYLIRNSLRCAAKLAFVTQPYQPSECAIDTCIRLIKSRCRLHSRKILIRAFISALWN